MMVFANLYITLCSQQVQLRSPGGMITDSYNSLVFPASRGGQSGGFSVTVISLIHCGLCLYH